MTEIESENKSLLRFGVMCNGHHLHHWQKLCIEEVLSLPYTKLEVLIINEKPSRKNSKLGFNANEFLYRLMKNIRHPKSYLPISIDQAFPQIEQRKVEPVEHGKHSDYFSGPDLNYVEGKNLDFILRFGFRILRGQILQAAKFGIWSYHHSDEKVYRGGPAGFWEIYNKLPTTGSILQKLNEKIDGGIILRKGIFKTCHHSYAEQIDQLMYGSAEWAKQVCIDIHHNEHQYFNDSASNSDAVMNKFPSLSSLIRFNLMLWYNRFNLHFNRLFKTEFWKIGIIDTEISSVNGAISYDDVNWTTCDDELSYFADPFGFVLDDKNILIFEHYDYRKQRANLFVADVNEKAQMNFGKGLIIKNENGKEVHASYPFLLEHNGKKYVIPETHGLDRIDLYEIIPETLELEYKTTLVEKFKGIDSSLIFFNDKWWLFTTEKSSGSNLKLHIFFSNDLFESFTSHLNNPVKTDVTSSRPGGHPFIKNGILFRPAQDCSTTYGSKIVIHKVLKMSPSNFVEIRDYEIYPKEKHLFKGIHTISTFGKKTLIDIKFYKFTLLQFHRNLFKRK